MKRISKKNILKKKNSKKKNSKKGFSSVKRLYIRHRLGKKMPATLGELLNISNDIKVYTCEDFNGNIEITIDKNMYLFYKDKLSGSGDMLSELPVDVFNMDIEAPTPGSNNYIPLDVSSDASLNHKVDLLRAQF